MKRRNIIDKIMNNEAVYQQGVSVDCVVFGFHDRMLKVLLSKFNFFYKWMLPVGFIKKDEDIDAAAHRVLKKITGLDNIYLYQFHAFGSPMRPNLKDHNDIMAKMGLKDNSHWVAQRFISVGYCALVEYSQVHIRTNANKDVRWFNLNEIPSLYSDHNNIIEKALSTIRSQINILPIGYKLLPEKFPLSELRIIYETILGCELDRRNFQRKILSTEYLIKLDEYCEKTGQKPTVLFSFDKKQCDKALQNII
ncbi:MAG: NUDIX domain-containing protein [Prevotellaceae bacterium]|nr:NUDIX domain-containing protein [Prevotellaceae bacterium]